MRSWALATCATLLTRSVLACPCSDDSAGSSVLAPSERAGAALVAMSRRSFGRFDALGNYSALSEREAESSEELVLRLALRAPARLEWLAELGYASYRLHAFDVDQRSVGPGDALLRARYELLSEPMPHADAPYLPGLVASALVRAPLGEVTSGSGNLSSSSSVLGLGTWEIGLGLEAWRAVLPHLSFTLGGEVGYRLSDEALGRVRQLGPRLDAAFGARYGATDFLTLNAAIRARFIGNARFGGQVLEGTDERLWTLSGSASLAEPWRHFRASVGLSFDPPLRSLSRGAAATAAASFMLSRALD